MDEFSILKKGYCFSFSGASRSGNPGAPSDIVVSQLYNKVYIVHPSDKNILVFDLQGKYLHSISVLIKDFKLGKLCLISDSVLCICDIRPSYFHSIYFVTNEGIVITKLNNWLPSYSGRVPPRRRSNYIECISSEEHNVFYIVTSEIVYSYGKEGVFRVPGIKWYLSYYSRIRGIRIIDKNMNLLVCYINSLYTYSTQGNKLTLLAKIRQSLTSFEVYCGYVICVLEVSKFLIISLETKKILIINNNFRWPIVQSLKLKYSCIHGPSRRIYLGNRSNSVFVYSLDSLLELYHKNSETSEIEDQNETPTNYYELFN